MAVNPNKYSIYAAENADKAQVDWGKVATDMSKTLSAVEAAKQKQRDQLDLDTQTAIETLSQVADVNSADAQALLLKGAEMSKQNLLIQSDLMKRNQIKPKDFMLFMQQQKAGYANLSAAIKNWDKYFTISQSRLTPDKDGVEASGIEIWAGKSMASFGNLKNKTLWTNPATGQMQLVEMMQDSNGNYSVMPDPNTNPEKFMNPNAMKSRMNIRINKKSLADEVKKLVDPLGQIIKKTIDETGKSIEKEGFRFTNIKSGVPDDLTTEDVDESTLSYVDWIESQVDSLTATSNDQVQILTNNGYTIAASESAFFRDCANQGGNCELSNWIRGDLSSGELVWNHIISEKDLKAEKAALITQRDALDDGSEKNILTQQIKEIDENLKNNKIEGGNILVNGLSDSQQEKARQIAAQAIDSQIDNIERKDFEPSPSHDNKKGKVDRSKHRITTIGDIYSNPDPEAVQRAMKSLLSTSGDRFEEFDQVTVKLDGGTEIVTEVIVPYIDSATGNKVSKNIVLHELKEGAPKGSTDPNDYVAVSPDEFTQGMYELVSMNDKDYEAYDQVKQFVNNKLKINASGSRVYKKTIKTPRASRKATTIESPLFSGKDQTTAKAIYMPALTKVTGASQWITEVEVQNLADSMLDSLRKTAAYQGDGEAANRVSITAQDEDSITITIEGVVEPIVISIPNAIGDARQDTFEGEIDKVMNDLLTTILPAIEAGWGDDDDPAGIF